MSLPSSPVLQQLHRLDGSSSRFHDQVSNTLYGEDYQRCVRNLHGDDSAWLVDYLDKVRRRVALPRSPLRPARPWMALIPPALLRGNVSASSEVYVAPAGYSRRHM